MHAYCEVVKSSWSESDLDFNRTVLNAGRDPIGPGRVDVRQSRPFTFRLGGMSMRIA
jgi:hypothetical protein